MSAKTLHQKLVIMTYYDMLQMSYVMCARVCFNCLPTPSKDNGYMHILFDPVEARCSNRGATFCIQACQANN